jgi:hypothetical protein
LECFRVRLYVKERRTHTVNFTLPELEGDTVVRAEKEQARGAVVLALMVSLAAMPARLADAASLEEVQQRGSLRLCANPSALPYSNRPSHLGGLRGFQVELADAVARELGLGLTVAWIRGANAAGKAACDASMDSIPLAASYEREGRMSVLLSMNG